MSGLDGELLARTQMRQENTLLNIMIKQENKEKKRTNEGSRERESRGLDEIARGLSQLRREISLTNARW